jgi:ABC-type antimicrobial peptide transport system permease subunit
VVQRFPNVSAIDLSIIRKTISEIVDRVSVAIRFLAVFSLAMGIPVLFSAVAATRRERVREGVLLKTLGATQGQIRRILFAEYALLGVLGSLTGMLLSFGGAWALLSSCSTAVLARNGAGGTHRRGDGSRDGVDRRLERPGRVQDDARWRRCGRRKADNPLLRDSM